MDRISVHKIGLVALYIFIVTEGFVAYHFSRFITLEERYMNMYGTPTPTQWMKQNHGDTSNIFSLPLEETHV